MRVIAGTARSLRLETVDGLDTRPTTDRIKETLFNILQPDLPGCRFLDLFSGSGAIAIEAISRGAKEAVLVENMRQAAKCIVNNLHHTKFENKATLITGDAVSSIDTLERRNQAFDIIFMDPPYGKDLERAVLTRLSRSSLVGDDTMIVVEASLDTDFAYAEVLGFEVYREKKYKTNKHVFMQKILEGEDDNE